jgi:hypothetical protein
MEQITQENDIVYQRIRLIAQFLLSAIVFVGVGIVILTPGTSSEADSGAAAVVTLVVTYWFSARMR